MKQSLGTALMLALMVMTNFFSVSIPAHADPSLFVVRTALSGVDYLNVSGDDEQLSILEQNGQGIALLDYDGDGLLDVYVSNGATSARGSAARYPGSRLYRNLGDWRFEDVSVSAGADTRRWGTGVAASDYDGDGDMDLYLAAWGPNVLLRNDGDGHFSDVSKTAGVADPRWSSSASFADFNGDGRLDLYVSNYVEVDPENVPAREADGSPCLYRGIATGCGPWRYPGERDSLFLQRADGTFEDASIRWGLDATAGFRGMGIAPGDFDLDGDVDLYIGCDVMPNLYLENMDRERFRSAGASLGGAVNADGQPESGMGVAAADLFDRGRLDILTTNFAGQKNTYYQNSGGRWKDESRDIGLGRHMKELGWGIIAEDFDQDGRRDVFVANGQIYPQVDQLKDPDDRYAQPPRLYLGVHEDPPSVGATKRDEAPRPILREVAPALAFEANRSPGSTEAAAGDSTGVLRFSLRAAAAGDLDRDGDVDVIAVQHRGPLVIFENQSNRASLEIELETREGGLSPHGAHLILGNWHHFHWPNHGYQSSHSPVIHLPAERIPAPETSAAATLSTSSAETSPAARRIEVEVIWPDGTRERRAIPDATETKRRVRWRQRSVDHAQSTGGD